MSYLMLDMPTAFKLQSEVELNFVVSVTGAFVTSELKLLDKVFVRYLCKATAFVSVKVDVVNEEGSR